MTVLLDSNDVIALGITEHTHTDHAQRWLARPTDAYATCLVTQGALVPVALRNGRAALDAVEVLHSFAAVHPDVAELVPVES